MNFPATTEQLLFENPRVHPDVVYKKLVTLSKLGLIRKIRGIWYEMRSEQVEQEENREYVKTYPRTRKQGIPCLVCGTPIKGDAVKYCSRDCYNIRQMVPRHPCKRCGKPVKENKRTFCSRDCTNAYKAGR